MDPSQSANIPLDRIRNIGVIAHIDAGKTTTTERILYYTGRTYKIGDIDEGTTQMDWMDQERERGITIVSAATTTFWVPVFDSQFPKETFRFNIIDTPGHVDFTAEVERSLRVLDGGITVLDANEGVQSQSETVWHQADKYRVPRICFVNKMDKIGADFQMVVNDIKDKLGVKPAIMTLPIGQESAFKGVVLLLEEQAIIWQGDETGAKYTLEPIPENLAKEVAKYRHQLIEQIAETDETLLDKYLNNEPLSVLELKRGLRQAVIRYELVPIYCGSSLRNKGVQPLLDAVVDYLPSPVDIKTISGTNPKNGQAESRRLIPEEPCTALAFKIQTDPHVGKLTYARVYSGVLHSGSYILNANTGDKERIGRLLLMHANDREDLKLAQAGEIVGIVGLKGTKTGHTLCDEAHPIVLEGIQFAEPVISLAIEPKTKADQEKMGIALNRLSEEDPTFRIKVDHDTGQTIISGMGELQLEVLVERMHREFKVDANVGNPQVAYRETITATATAEGKYIRQSGGRGQYGHCFLRVEPKVRGEGFEFVNEITGGRIPREFIPAIEKGVKEAMENGVMAGYPLVDMSVAVYDGSFHEVDSSEIAFKIAGSIALQAGVKKAGLTLLEPIMKVEVTTPDDFMGDVIGDLSSRRAQILDSTLRARSRIITALVPLAEMSRYATILRSLTQGRAYSYMEPSHYEPVPSQIAQTIVETNKPARSH